MVHLRSGETVEVHNSLELMEIEILHADDFEAVDLWKIRKQKEAEQQRQVDEMVERQKQELFAKNPILQEMERDRLERSHQGVDV